MFHHNKNFLNLKRNNMSEKKLGLSTLAFHVGQKSPDPATGSRAFPIYQTAPYVFKSTDHAAYLFALKELSNIYIRVQLLRELKHALSLFNSFLFHQGVETLALLQERHSENALDVAKFLKSHPAVSWVNYLGLEEHPSHVLAEKYLKDKCNAILGSGIKSGLPAAKKFVESLQLLSHLVNIGDSNSPVIHPALTTHQQLTPAEQEATGVTPDFIRVSVGIKDVEDIIADLDQALAKAVL
jgi:O-acetylhomoserine/O-acetylserine sulfhydrylase-like pyridoxal-dependent enzyme